MLADTATPLALFGSAAFFINVMDSCDGHGEPTQAGLSLPGAKIRVAHPALPAQRPIKNENGNPGVRLWPTAPLERRIH
jgi:hypothetical protein